jgi:hypothetical protein
MDPRRRASADDISVGGGNPEEVALEQSQEMKSLARKKVHDLFPASADSVASLLSERLV